jgi:hypothetical protein
MWNIAAVKVKAMEKISKADLLKKLREIESDNPCLKDYSIYSIVECIKNALAPYEVFASFETTETSFAGKKRIASISIETKRKMCKFQIEQYGNEGAYRTYFSDIEFFKPVP